MFKSVYFDSIRSYLPDEAKAILVDQIPKIREAVAADIDDFGKSLGAKLKKELDDAFDAQQKAAGEVSTQLRTLVDSIGKKGSEHLAEVTRQLKESIDAYENQWKTLGAKAREIAVAAVKSAGIPLPI